MPSFVKLTIRRKDFSKLICCVERKRIFNRRCILSWNFEKEEAKIRRISFREFIIIVWKSRGFGKICSFQNWQAGIEPRSIYSFSNSHFDAAQSAVGSQAPFPFTEKVTSLTLIVEQVHLENLWVSLSSTATAVFQGCRWKEKKQKTASVNVLFNPLTFLRRERVYFMCI